MKAGLRTRSVRIQKSAPIIRQAGLLQRKCACGGVPTGPSGECASCRHQRLTSQKSLTQPGLTLSRPDDRYEQEADQVADRVIQMPESGILQRHTDKNSTDTRFDSITGKTTPLVQRETDNEEEDEEKNITAQAKQAEGQSPTVPAGITQRINKLRDGGQPLSPETRQYMEPRFGHDFSKVRVHNTARAAATAQSINARAFTFGNNIVFGASHYTPATTEGQRLLAHELTHVIQQGKSAPLPDTMTQSGYHNSVAGPTENSPADATPLSGNTSATVQRKLTLEDPKKKIPRPGGKGLDQTNATTVQNYLSTLCKSGSPSVSSSGKIDVGKGFCTPMLIPTGFGLMPMPPPAAFSKTPTGCGCVCDMVHSKHSWRIKVDDINWPHTDFDDRDAANGKKPGGTGGLVTTPSPNSPKLWGAATAKGKALDIDPWLVLGHELCGHGWLGNYGKHGPDVAKARGKGGHQETVKRENKLRAEHGIDLRGTHKDPYCGESYWRDKKKAKKINWSSFLNVCKQWRKEYNKKHKTKYKISDKIP